MRLLALLSASLFLTACNDETSIQCIGNVDYMREQTNVVFEEKGFGGLTVRYPLGTNVKSDVDKIYASEAFLVLGVMGEMGVGIWHINRETKKFQYLQSKDLEFVGVPGFNSDDYQGSCSALSGDIGQL